MSLKQTIRRVLVEETEKFDKVEFFIKRATTLINNMKFHAVKRVEFDYDEMMDGFHVNIFFDKQLAINNPKNFNKVKQNAIKEIGSTITTFFPFKFYIYLHYD
jgi:short-subunit dehydrogenase